MTMTNLSKNKSEMIMYWRIVIGLSINKTNLNAKDIKENYILKAKHKINLQSKQKVNQKEYSKNDKQSKIPKKNS